MEELFSFDTPRVICGIDEAGRGPLAGPVTAAAVVLPPDFPVSILADSKKLSQKQLLEAEAVIREKALCWSIRFISNEEIQNYIDRGYVNFKIVGRGMPLEFVKESYLYFLVKDEHRDFIRTKIDYLLTQAQKVSRR